MWQKGDSKSDSDKLVESDEKQEQKSEIVEDDIKEKEHKNTSVNDELETKTHEYSFTAGNAHFSTSLCPDKKEISSNIEVERAPNFRCEVTMWQEGDSKSGSDKIVESDEKQEQKAEIVEDDIKDKEHKKTSVNDELETKTHEDSLTAGNAHFSTSLCTAKKEFSFDMEEERELNFQKKTNISSIQGVHTVLCIDTSDTMTQNDAWDQTKAFVKDFGTALREEYQIGRTYYYTAVVTFGEETKVQQQLTKDLSLVRDVIENTELGGDSKLEAGLRFSKDVVLSLNKYDFTVNKTRILPRIIVISDGRAIVQDQSQLTGNEKFNRLKEEMTGIREKNIEIHFVYVGDPDYIFLHKLREISKGELSPHTTGLRIAKDALFKQILYLKKGFSTSQLKRKNIDENDASTEHDDRESLDVFKKATDENDASTEHDAGESPDVFQQVLEMLNLFTMDESFIKRMLNEISTMSEKLKSDQSDDEDIQRPFAISMLSSLQTMLMKFNDSTIEEGILNFDKMDVVMLLEKVGSLLKEVKNELYPNLYKEETYLQQHAPIGCRVRRGQDWGWANQDNGGPGTIIGHLYDELKRYWCYVEWDIGGHINAYRWDVPGKCDLAIVDEERVPVEGDIISVGCKVRPGESYEGNSSHVLGIAIKRLDDNKMQVRWKNDGSREDLTYGKEGTLRQLMLLCVEETKKKKENDRSRNDADNIPVFEKSASKTLLASPVLLKVDDVFETSATVLWQESIDEKKSSSSKYVVTYIEKSKPQKKIAVEVVAAFFCILDDLKEETEYSVEIKLVNDGGESLPTRSSSFITRRKDTDDSFFAGWKLTDKDASRLSQALGENWEILAPALGIPNVLVHHIRLDNKTTTLRIYQMLLQWMQNNSKSTFGKFCEILKKYPNVYVERSIMNEMKEEYRLIMEKKSVPKDL